MTFEHAHGADRLTQPKTNSDAVTHFCITRVLGPRGMGLRADITQWLTSAFEAIGARPC